MNTTKTLLCALLLAALSCSEDLETQNPDENPDDSKESTTLAMPENWGVTPDPDAFTLNAVSDFGVERDTGENQSSKLQIAIDQLEAYGGGNLIIPAGVYHFSTIYMRNGVHILVSKDATLKPYIPEGGYPWVNDTNMIEFSRWWSGKDSNDYVENCSISCYEGGGAKYTVDYSDLYADIEANHKLFSVMELGGTTGSAHDTLMNELFDAGAANRARFIRVRLVRNFLIADAHIIDNYTTCCGMVFIGAENDGPSEILRPTNGVVRNCSIENACHGYGLCQLHAAQDIFFEDLWAEGGVTLRLEAHVGNNVGVYNIFGHNIYNEYGRAAVMMLPHATDHGKVTIDGVESKSSAHCVLICPGYVSEDSLAANPDAQPGTFTNDCRINNIKAVYGTNAQIDDVDIWIYDPRVWKDDPTKNQYDTIKSVLKSTVKGATGVLTKYADFYQYEAGSYAPIFDDTQGQYTVSCTNVTYEGYPYEVEGGVLRSETLEFDNPSAWNGDVVIPIFEENYKLLDYSLKD